MTALVMRLAGAAGGAAERHWRSTQMNSEDTVVAIPIVNAST